VQYHFQPIRREGYDTTQIILIILGHHGDSWFPFFPPVPVPGINGTAPVSTGTKSLVSDIPPVPGPHQALLLPEEVLRLI